MKTEIESKCCMSVDRIENRIGQPICITENEHFNAALLNSTVLKISWIQFDLLRCDTSINAALTK